MNATKTITKRGNAERVPCYVNGRSIYSGTGEPSIDLEVRMRNEGGSLFSGEFKVGLSVYEARNARHGAVYAEGEMTQAQREELTRLESATTSYRTIPLTRDKFSIVDEADYGLLSQFKWNAQLDKRSGRLYAARNHVYLDGIKRIVFMHRQILGLERGDPRQGDHRDPGLTLDNRRSNLRVATVAENSRNCRIRKDNTSGFKGVRWHSGSKKWEASIAVDGKRIRLGDFADINHAADAYSKAAEKYHGEFARIK